MSAAVIGSVVGTVLIGSLVPGLVWRAAALSSALTLVSVAMIRVVVLGRSEWRREPPPRGQYRRVVARFATAFLLVIIASS